MELRVERKSEVVLRMSEAHHRVLLGSSLSPTCHFLVQMVRLPGAGPASSPDEEKQHITKKLVLGENLDLLFKHLEKKVALDSFIFIYDLGSLLYSWLF